ncbi:hypothetical protein DERP_003040 [Dermatophagoides pteronyssinus]|uniref:N-acetylserotonin O-methyltransferase-like protein n=1 Tax=Dermatophagoides pteronyssinus TaxID=6956 RepID=A0ABQ8JIZ4_DERPT|nr:hypothetical protein DERP_003040 [Dermatophagoides pteronyssinus]
MLEPIRHIISRQRNILASSSIRRKEILQSVQFNFEIIRPEFEENLDKNSFTHPCEYVKENAKQKALSVWRQLARNNNDDDNNNVADLVIGCDTVVTLDEKIYEKPKDDSDAIRMLMKLSGRTHTVFTGVALITRSKSISSSTLTTNIADQQQQQQTLSTTMAIQPQQMKKSSSLLCIDGDDYLVTTFHEATDVTISEMDKTIIESYVKTGEPLDKAGSYGIQGIGATLIESIRGDYFNVVGLPLHRLAKELYYMYTE